MKESFSPRDKRAGSGPSPRPRRVMFEVSGSELVQKPITAEGINADPRFRKSPEVKRLEEAAEVLLKAGFSKNEIPTVFEAIQTRIEQRKKETIRAVETPEQRREREYREKGLDR